MLVVLPSLHGSCCLQCLQVLATKSTCSHTQERPLFAGLSVGSLVASTELEIAGLFVAAIFSVARALIFPPEKLTSLDYHEVEIS